jgi:hypothetical protein
MKHNNRNNQNSFSFKAKDGVLPIDTGNELMMVKEGLRASSKRKILQESKDPLEKKLHRKLGKTFKLEGRVIHKVSV